MFSNLKNVFKVPDLRNKILFVMAMVALYRVGVAIRVPGIDADAVRQFKAAANTQGALGFFNLLPIAPLDGFKVAVGLLPEQLASRFARTAQWGMFVLIALMLMGTVTARLGLPILDILGTLVTGPTQAVVSRLLGLPL